MSGNAWVITVVAMDVRWRKATAAALVREAHIAPAIAAAWARIRREMSPAGLKRKMQEQRN